MTSSDKTDQDKFLVKFMEKSVPQRRIVNTKNAKNKTFVFKKYHMRKESDEKVCVCFMLSRKFRHVKRIDYLI